jgi:uncharacterized protein YllA (UPF0747 family)
LQKDVVQQRMQQKKDKKRGDLENKIDQLERDLPNQTADLVIDKLKRS